MEHIVSVHDLFRVRSTYSIQPTGGRGSAVIEGMVKMLTRKQYELLRFINERLKEAGVPPRSTK